MKDDIGDRMKEYEMMEAGRRLMPLLPVLARLDGRCFSHFTQDLRRPYDQRLSELMIATTFFLARETCAVCGYTQSDEITLAWYSNDYQQSLLFNGRIQKWTSVLAALASVAFNRQLPQLIPEKANLPVENLPVFDCRVWNVPNLEEGANAFLWREQDATKNSVSMATRHYYSHQEIENKSSAEMQEMLFQKGVNWNDYPSFFKRGTYIQRRKVQKPFTTEEWDALPARHEARRDPDLKVERTEWTSLELPPLSRLRNRVQVIFFGAEPLFATAGSP